LSSLTDIPELLLWAGDQPPSSSASSPLSSAPPGPLPQYWVPWPVHYVHAWSFSLSESAIISATTSSKDSLSLLSLGIMTSHS
jgi:hypothetical protein